MRGRARELGWSDAEVARRLDIAQTRYGNYVTDRNEPDLGTLVRISEVLGVTTEFLLKDEQDGFIDINDLQRQVSAATKEMDHHDLAVVLTVAKGLKAKSRNAQPGRGKRRVSEDPK